MTRTNIFAEIDAERARQDAKWGEQNHPSRSNELHGIMSADSARSMCDARFADGRGAWADIAVEELAEAIDAPDEVARRAELVQLAAVVVAWIECIDRRAP